MECPQCKSDNVQKLSIIYQLGTQKINTSSRSFGSGVGGGRGGFIGGFGSSSTTTTGTSQSLIAKMAAPPAKKTYVATVILFLIGGIILATGSYIFIGLLLIGGGGFMAYKDYNYNQNEWPPINKNWQNSWHCNKCGEIYALQLSR